MDEILEYLIQNGEITKEKFDELVAAKQKELAVNPPPFVADVKERADMLFSTTEGMKQIDNFTLEKTFMNEETTEGMKVIDDFTLQLVFELQQEVSTLKEEIEQLKGGN